MNGGMLSMTPQERRDLCRVTMSSRTSGVTGELYSLQILQWNFVNTNTVKVKFLLICTALKSPGIITLIQLATDNSEIPLNMNFFDGVHTNEVPYNWDPRHHRPQENHFLIFSFT